MVSLLILAIALLAQGAPTQRTITVVTLTGRDVVTFYPARTSEDDVRRWIRLSPNIADSNGYAVPESLAFCAQSDPEYRDCGTRDWRAKSFVVNANVNLRRIRERIKTLGESAYPPELGPVISHLKQIQESSLFFSSQMLAYIQSGQASTLSASFGGVNSASDCSAEIAKVAAAQDRDLGYLAAWRWRNCVNHALQDKIGPYPAAAWNNFLSQHGIRERLIEDPVD